MSSLRTAPLLAGLVASALALSTPRSARACDAAAGAVSSDLCAPPTSIPLYAGIAFTAADLIAFDVVATDDRPTQLAVGAEISITGASLLTYAAFAADDRSLLQSPFFWVGSGLSALILSHGIYEAATVDFRPVPSFPQRRTPTESIPSSSAGHSAHVAFAPTLMPTGTPGHESLAPAFTAWGSF